MTEFIPQGILDMYAKGHRVNTNSKPAEVLQTTRRLSNREEIIRIRDEENLGIYTSKLGTQFVFLPPAGRYVPYDLMTVVYPDDCENGFETQEIYNLHPMDQIIYWKLQVESLKHATELISLYAPEEDVAVFTTQNCTNFLGNETVRSPRTWGLVHFRTLALPKKYVIPSSRLVVEARTGKATGYVWDHLWNEWGFLRSRSNKIIKGIASRIPSELEGKYEIEARHSPPIGYSIAVPLPETGLTSWEDIQQVMYLNHKAFIEVCEPEDSSKILGKGGSYRQYAYLDLSVSKLVVPISLVEKSWSGPMEAAGIMLERSKRCKKLISDEETLAFQIELTQRLLEESKSF